LCRDDSVLNVFGGELFCSGVCGVKCELGTWLGELGR
jgi:hypothetical protein